MPLRRLLLCLSILIAPHSLSPAQQQQEGPAAPPARDAQDDVRVFTEEVRIPLFAYDEHGRYDPSLEMRDVLILEDGVPQEVRSLRRIPSSILLVLGTGGEMNPAMRTSLTREIALNLVSNLREGDHVSVLQFSNRVELLQDWTIDAGQVVRALRTKLHSGRGSLLAPALEEAAARVQSQPIGNRHVVLVTDGVDTPAYADYQEALRVLTDGPSGNAGASLSAAVRRLNAAQATLHVISYTAIARTSAKEQEKRRRQSAGPSPGSTSTSGISRAGIDPTLPPGMNRGGIGGGPSLGATVSFDPQMKRLRRAYERAMKRSETQMASLAAEMGGRIWLPLTPEEMLAQAGAVAREIGSQYVLTYRPKRPLATAPPAEYREIRVNPRRSGLQLRARRGYLVAAMR